MNPILLEPIVRTALQEDLGRAGDVTAGLMRPDERLHARFSAREAGVAAGLAPARLAFSLLDARVTFTSFVSDGTVLSPGDVLAEVQGPAESVLSGERTALNFLTHLSGITTLTRRFVEAVEGTRAKIAATRKTLPGLRVVQKAAVIAGGGLPHRYGLDDAVLIKDNHIAACGSISEALARARRAAGHMRVIEIEVDTLAQLDEALRGRPDVILLDNFSIEDLRTAVAKRPEGTLFEASGGVSLETVRRIAETGVDIISVGALTHSAPTLDIGLDAV
jgi:nicotinate-nucleotide pyrophosphorylase (carboxylating)